MRAAARSPPSSFTDDAPPCFTSAAALATASSSEASYVPNGRSTMTCARDAPRAAAAPCRIMSASSTLTVESKPSTTIPSESPTRITSIPAASAQRAKGASYAELREELRADRHRGFCRRR